MNNSLILSDVKIENLTTELSHKSEKNVSGFKEKSFMTTKELANVLEVSTETIRANGKELFPDLFINGKTTYFNEKQCTAIKMKIEKHHNLQSTLEVMPKTKLEKHLLIKQAMMLQDELISELQAENEKQKQELLEQQPKVEYYDNFIDSTNLVEIGHLGKTTKIGEQKIFKKLVAEGFIKVRYSTDGVKYYDPCCKYDKYFKSISVPFLRGDKQLNREKLMLTSEGFAYFMKKFN